MNDKNKGNNIMILKLNNTEGMALVITLILLAVLMYSVLTFSNIAVKSQGISQSGVEFRKNFDVQTGINILGDYYVFNFPLASSGLFAEENISTKSVDFIGDGNWELIIKKSLMSKKTQKDAGSILYRKEKFVSGYQINSGGGKGTQGYRRAGYQLYTLGQISGGNNVLVFRNWLEKADLTK